MSSLIGNAPESMERRKALQTIATSTLMVMVVADLSDALGASNAPVSLDRIPEIQSVNRAHTLKESGFDVRESYGMVRSVFGGTIGRTAEYYGVSRKTIYQWNNSEQAPSLQNRQLERAKSLESAATFVRAKLGRKAKNYTREIVGESSLDEILAAESIDFTALQTWVDELERKLQGQHQNRTLAEMLSQNGFFPPEGEEDLEPLI